MCSELMQPSPQNQSGSHHSQLLLPPQHNYNTGMTMYTPGPTPHCTLATIQQYSQYSKHEYNDKRLIINSKLCQYISCMPDSRYSNVKVQ